MKPFLSALKALIYIEKQFDVGGKSLSIESEYLISKPCILVVWLKVMLNFSVLQFSHVSKG